MIEFLLAALLVAGVYFLMKGERTRSAIGTYAAGHKQLVAGGVILFVTAFLLWWFWGALPSISVGSFFWEQNDTTIVRVVLAVLVLILILDSMDSFSIRGAIKTGIILGILACVVWLIWFDNPSAKAQGICPPDDHLEVAQIGEAYALTAGCTYTFDVKELPRKANGQPDSEYDGIGVEFEKRYIRELVEEEYSPDGRYLKLTPKEEVFEYEKRAPEITVAFNKLGERSTPAMIAKQTAESEAAANAAVSDLIGL